jgi:hypothetical protein
VSTPLIIVLVLVTVASLPSLFSRFGKPAVVDGNATINHYLSGPCPKCGSSLEAHDWAMFATAVASEANKTRLEEFFEKARAHDWQGLKAFSDWEGTQNAMEAYVVRCSSGGVVFVVWNPYELFDSDELYMRENVSADEMLEIEKLLSSTSWHIGSPSTK